MQGPAAGALAPSRARKHLGQPATPPTFDTCLRPQHPSSAPAVQVILPNGEQIRVTGGGGRGGGGGGGGAQRYQQTGDVIDAEYTDIRS